MRADLRFSIIHRVEMFDWGIHRLTNASSDLKHIDSERLVDWNVLKDAAPTIVAGVSRFFLTWANHKTAYRPFLIRTQSSPDSKDNHSSWDPFERLTDRSHLEL